MRHDPRQPAAGIEMRQDEAQGAEIQRRIQHDHRRDDERERPARESCAAEQEPSRQEPGDAAQRACHSARGAVLGAVDAAQQALRLGHTPDELAHDVGGPPEAAKQHDGAGHNADESEPGTFKDHVLMERNPHLLIEGCAIGCYAIGAKVAYIYIRGEFYHVQETLERAIEEAYRAGFLGKNILGSGFDCDVYVHRGAGAYEAGEETALIESLEGKRAQPRIKPPFPAVAGLYQCPTAVNNVETLCNVPLIVLHGPEWFSALGPEKNGGPKLYCISGHVKRPGVYEASMHTTLRELIYGDQYARACSAAERSRPSSLAGHRCRSCSTRISTRRPASTTCRRPARSSGRQASS